MADLEHILRSGLDQLDPAIDQPDGGQQQRLLRYIDELVQWNSAYNLTAVREPAQMIDRHLLDSLVIAPFVQGEQVLDVGAGAGLPGIPLAIVQPERRFTLLDSNGKKVRFMRHAVRALALPNATVEQTRVEQYSPTGVDTILARAFAPVEQLLRLIVPICRSGTVILAMRGRDEPFTLIKGFKQLDNQALKVPRSAAPRHLLILERE